MNKFIIPNFDDFFWYLKVDGVHKTSNASELNFQKSLPKHAKRRMHIIEGGSKQRIYLKNEHRKKKSDEQFNKFTNEWTNEILINNYPI
jgi:hypothetical protein